MAKRKVKNIFSYDETTSRMGLTIDGAEFVVRRADPALAAKLEAMGAEADSAQKAANLPLVLRIVELIFALFGASFLAGAVESLADAEVPFSEMVKNGFWYFIGFGAGMLIVAGILFIFNIIRKRRVMASPAIADLNDRCTRLEREIAENLSVPDTAIAADLFVPVRGKFHMSAIANKPVRYYTDQDALCIATLGYVVRIPYERIEEVACVKRRIVFHFWNKEVPCGKEPYKKYKIRAADGGQFTVKPYYAVSVRGSELFEFLIPPYEFECIAPLLGSKGANVIERK